MASSFSSQRQMVNNGGNNFVVVCFTWKNGEGKERRKCKKNKMQRKKKEIRMKTNMTFSCFVFPVMKNSCKHK